MSSPQALFDAVSSLLTAEYCTFAAFSLVVYDWLINLDEEINCFWNLSKGGKLNAAALLYGMSRYPTMLQTIFLVQTVYPMSDTNDVPSCKANQHLQTAASTLNALAPAVFSAIRVFAVSPNSKFIAALSFLLLFGPNMTALVLNAMDKTAVLPSPFNCSNVGSPISADVVNRLNIAARVANIAGELIVLFVTWVKTYTSYKAQRGVLKGPSLARVMLYNGSLYFIILTVMYILVLVLSQAPSTVTLGNFASVVTAPITAVLTCHFLFALRQADRKANTGTLSSPSAIASLNFAAAASHLGSGSHGTLPDFLASIGSEVQTGLHVVDSVGADEDSEAQSDEIARCEEDWGRGNEDGIGMADMSAGRGERVEKF